MLEGKTIGFIGTGNMGEALIQGLINNQIMKPDRIWCGDIRKYRLDEMSEKYGVQTSMANEEVIKNADIIIYAVKPQGLAEVMKGSAGFINDSKLIISIAAGITIELMEKWLPEKSRIIRAMPNMCVTVQEGMTALVAGSHVMTTDLQFAGDIFNAVGKSLVLGDESLMDVVTGLSASGPAYVFIILEALADAGVHMGLPREEALTLSAQTLLGAAAVYLNSRIHPGQLKDIVTSPGGTTIAGLGALEKGGIRYTLRDAVVQATSRSRELGRMTGHKSDET
jgi:pyrroline-5-carboxylate reductase